MITKRLPRNGKMKNIVETIVSNLLSKVKDIIAKDEVIPGFISVMQEGKIHKKKKRNITCHQYQSSLSNLSLTATLRDTLNQSFS